MADESEKPEQLGDADDDSKCPISRETNTKLDTALAALVAKLLEAGAEDSILEATMHAHSHMLRWQISMLWGVSDNDPVRCANVLMTMLSRVAEQDGVALAPVIRAVNVNGGGNGTKH